ncbi:MAG: multicopper oxidase domain-containing protein [Alphaproteobacteria bacterium]|nr:multicopper oxidase domain-containing protein [Alphaproteobacteria bacterium]
MVMKFFALVGLVAVIGGLYLILPQGIGPTAFQMAPARSAIPAYIEEGLFPEPASLVNNEAIGHAIFENPAEDAERIAEAQARMAETMPGMDMDNGGAEMDMDNGGAEMDMAATGEAEMPADMNMGNAEPEMDNGGAGMDNGGAGMDMPATGEADTMRSAEAEMDMAATGEAEMPADMNMNTAEVVHDEEGAEEMVSGGLIILAQNAAVDREIEIDMREWGYSLGELEVNPGERIRLTIRNAGEIPHEFMFMPMANMQAIAYRLERADWNLLEHDAPFEQSVLMPGETFQVSVQIETAGAWMFMCMFPFHMQMGMMGQMATPGMAMEM